MVGCRKIVLNRNKKSILIFKGSINLNVYDGTFLAVQEKLIVVSCNYRVGALGFLYLNTSSVPGNAGLADQMLAIEWYKDIYLKFFDGSSTNLCLFGESAGGISIHYHLNSRKNQTFRCAVLQSGTAYLDIAYREPHDALKVSLDFAKLVNCSQDDLNDTIECLKRVPVDDIIKYQYEIKYINSYLQMQFVPTIDYYKYVYTNPRSIVNYKHQNQRVLIGSNQQEGTFFLFYVYKDKYFNLSEVFTNYKVNDDFVSKILSEMLYTHEVNPLDDYKTDVDLYARCLTKLYNSYDYLRFNEIMSDDQHAIAWKKISKILGDLTFTCPSLSLYRIINGDNVLTSANSTSAHLYKFTHRSLNNPWPEWIGATHGYEIEFVFGTPWLFESQYTSADRDVSTRMMKYWADFNRA
jgi:acetylcholinesterase